MRTLSRRVSGSLQERKLLVVSADVRGREMRDEPNECLGRRLMERAPRFGQCAQPNYGWSGSHGHLFRPD